MATPRKTRQKLTIWQVRALSDNHEKKELRKYVQRLPPELAQAVRALQEQVEFTGLGDQPRWNGIVLAVKHLSKSWAIYPPGARALRYARALCVELARHPDLTPSTDDRWLRHLSLDLVKLYNALQRYLVELERVVGKDADRDQAPS